MGELMYRHEKVRGILKDIISQVDDLEKQEFNDNMKRSQACDKISEQLHQAFFLVTQLKKEFEEKI